VPGRFEFHVVRSRACDHIGKIDIVGLKTQLDRIETCVPQFKRTFLVQSDTARDQIGVKTSLARRDHKISEIAPNERLAAGKTDLEHAKRSCLANDANPLSGREIRLFAETRGIRAIGTMERTLVSDFRE
jgi:hypothetical protein